MAGDIGSFLLSLALVSSVIGGLSYLRSIRSGNPVDLNVARGGFYVVVFAVMFASAILMYLILGHHFEYNYVWAHSSVNLARPFLFASFYSGQEGSFMLWTLLTALIGVFVIGYAQRYRYEAEAMSVYLLVLALLLLILVVDSPFETIYAAFADQQLPSNFIPADGRGLNPQLENLWITIHPPILFTGFASMTVPFVFGLAGLMRRDYQKWINIALPWTLFACMVLGFGIMLGGWWAYETLGWGGYWAWDPVENSSLIPWLICVGLLHTMLVQKRTGSVVRGVTKRVGGLARTNFVLAVAAFGGILYSTFLTRSGILEDTSVHSFVTPGSFVQAILEVILVVFFGLGVAFLIMRWKDLSKIPLHLKAMSRENWLGIGSALLLASAFIILVGTSWPILMPLIGNPKAKIDNSFYDNTHLWLGIAIVAINGLSILLHWKNTTKDELRQNLLVAVPVAAVLTVGLALATSVGKPLFVILLFGALLSLVTNLWQGWKFVRRAPRMTGAFVAHAGLALLVIGVLFTSGYSMTKHVQLVEGNPAVEVFGYNVSYEGSQQIEKEKADREKFQHIVRLEKNGSTEVVKPVIFWSDFNKREQAFLEPGIVYTPTRDLYISPKSLETVGGDPTALLAKGEVAPVPQDSSISVRFEKFDMSRAATDSMQGAVLEVATADSTMYLTLYRRLDGRYGMTPIPGSDIKLGFGELQANPEELSQSKARIVFASSSVKSPPAQRAITVDVSIKPFISFVWGGVIVMVIGFFISILRRRRELEIFANELDRYNEGEGTESENAEVETDRSSVQGGTEEAVENDYVEE